MSLNDWLILLALLSIPICGIVWILIACIHDAILGNNRYDEWWLDEF